MRNPYKVLGVSATNSKAEIKATYKQLSKKYHPDNLETGNVVKFKAIKEAWEYIDTNHKDSTLATSKSIWRHKTLFSVYKEVL